MKLMKYVGLFGSCFVVSAIVAKLLFHLFGTVGLLIALGVCGAGSRILVEEME